MAVALRNNTNDWVEIGKGTPITWMEATNQVPPVDGGVVAVKAQAPEAMSEAQRQEAVIQKLDLSGLQGWEPELAIQARNLPQEYHDLFSLEKHEIGQTKTVEHKIVLLNPETPPFKERFWGIPPPQVDEVREHLKMMLDAGAIHPSNSPWCNAVVLVRKKDSTLRFYSLET